MCLCLFLSLSHYSSHSLKSFITTPTVKYPTDGNLPPINRQPPSPPPSKSINSMNHKVNVRQFPHHSQQFAERKHTEFMTNRNASAGTTNNREKAINHHLVPLNFYLQTRGIRIISFIHNIILHSIV